MPEGEIKKFERVNAVYKTVDGIPFEVSMLVPRIVISSNEDSAGSPILVHFHDGGLVLGTALEAHTLPKWMLQLADRRGAVIVSPCYRLLPEATGSDILEDIRDFWAWMYHGLQKIVLEKWSHLCLDLNRVAAGGQGSGGFLALQSAFLWPDTRIKAIMAQHCALDPESPAFNPRPRQASPELDRYVSECLARVRPGTFRISSPFPEYFELLHAVFQTGRWRDLLGDDRSLHIRTNLHQAKEIPPIWMVQGSTDRLISRVAANELVDEIRSAHPRTPVLYHVLPGGHGFDVSLGLEEDWIQQGVGFVDEYW